MFNGDDGFSEQYPHLDSLKLIKMCIIHDLGEAIGGDIAAIEQVEGSNKGEQERLDLITLIAPLLISCNKIFLCFGMNTKTRHQKKQS